LLLNSTVAYAEEGTGKRKAYDSLGTGGKALYTILLDAAKKVASGTSTSSFININSDIPFDDSEVVPSADGPFAAAIADVHDALLYDNPCDFYWYQTAAGMGQDVYYKSTNGTNYKLTSGSYFYFVVASDYGEGDSATTVDKTKIATATSVIENAKVPVIIDADALNIISDMTELKEYLGENTVLTPHLMEFSRLTGLDVGTIKASPLKYAREFCEKYGTNLVLKDKTTYIVLFDGSAFMNTTGDSTLSKGGSGDILAGLIGSLLAQKMPICDALPTAVYLHGKAGERAGEKLGQRGALARDVILSLAEEIKQF